MPNDEKFVPDMRVVGQTGLPVWGGRVYDEQLRDLQGDRGRRILREMSEQDPIIGGTFLGIEMLSRQVPWTLKPADDTKKAKDIADFVDECLTDLNPGWEDTLSEILSMLAYGWSWLEMVYKKREGLDLEDDLRSSRYDDGKIGWASWAIRSQETLDSWVWENDNGTGNLLALKQWVPSTGLIVEIPRKKSLHFKTRSRRQNPEGISILRNAYRAWYFKNNIEKIEGIGIERDLAGLPVIWAPQSMFDPEASDGEQALMTTLKQIVTAIKRDEQEGLVMPMAYDAEGKNPLFKLELLSTGGDRQFDTSAIISRYDARIAMSMLADFMLIGHEGGGGSFALSSSKMNLFSTALSAILDIIAAEINLHAIPQLVRLNGWPLNKVPTLMHGKIETADLAKLGEFLKQLYAAGMSLFPNSDLEAYVLDIAGLPGRDPGAGVLPGPFDPMTGLPVAPQIDPQTGLPMLPKPTVVPPTNNPADPTAPPVKQKQDVGGRQRAQTTPVNASRPRAKIAASESKQKHFTPLAQRFAKLHTKLSASMDTQEYTDLLRAVMDAGSFGKLSEEHQALIVEAETAE